MRVIWGLLVAIVLMVIAAVVLVVALPGEKIAKLAADQIKAQTGRALVFDGEVGISWFPVLGVSTGPVSLSNADWSDAGVMFAAQSATIGVDVMAALGGTIRIKKIELIAPDVLLEKARDGQVNWTLLSQNGAATAESTDEGQSAIKGFALENLVVRGARVRFVDHGGDSFEIADLDIDMGWPGLNQPVTVNVTARPAEEAVTLSAQIDDLPGLLGGGISAVVAKVVSKGGVIDFDGRAGLAPEVAGRVSVDLTDRAAFFAALGQEAELAGPVALSGDITLTRNMVFSLRNGALSALGNSVTAAADVTFGGGRPVVTAQISATTLDLSSLSQGGAAADTGAQSGGGGWSKAAIDASALALVDGQISFAAEAIKVAGLDIGRTRATIKIDNARAVATLSELAAYDGAMTGNLVVNNRGGLSVRGDLVVTQVALKGVLAATAGLNRFTGKADVTTNFLGSGASMYDILNSLSGAGTMKVGRGTIEGMDLDKLFRGDLTGGTTVFDSMGASWTLSGGVMTNDDLHMDLPRILAKGAGTVGLGQRVIDYTFTPQLKRDDGKGLAVPVKIQGSWDNPKITPDLEALLKQNLDEERKALEDQAVKALEKELGVTKEDGQSTEDAVRKALEKEAKKGLFDLLGNN